MVQGSMDAADAKLGSGVLPLERYCAREGFVRFPSHW